MIRKILDKTKTSESSAESNPESSDGKEIRKIAGFDRTESLEWLNLLIDYHW
jgi:hypothetical protein